MNTIYLLSIKKNQYGQSQYIEHPQNENTTELSNLKANEFWTIKTPSPYLQSILDSDFVGWKLYGCSSGTWALSPNAGTIVKPEYSGQGVSVLIKFIDPNDKIWTIFVADNKHYIQLCQGGLKLNEKPIDGAKREVWEELAIDLAYVNLVKIGKYDFVGGYELVDCFWLHKTTVYAVWLPWSYVNHLFFDKLENGINIMDVQQYEFKLDELTHVIAIPDEIFCDSVAESFAEIKKIKRVDGNFKEIDIEFSKSCHHRQYWQLFNTTDPIMKPDRLKSIEFNKRLPEALIEFKKMNNWIL